MRHTARLELRSPGVETMTELRGRGRPRSTGDLRCDRCERLVPKIRVHWPEGAICGACFSAAVNTYGICAHCTEQRMIPGRSSSGEHICRECAGIRTNLTCDSCHREAERLRRGQCAQCIVSDDLTAILKPNDPPDLRLHRLIRELATTSRPRSTITWIRMPAPRRLLTMIGDRSLSLDHAAFDALPASPAVEHLREMLTHHRILPSRGDVHLARFIPWLDTRLDEFRDRPHIHQPLEQFGRWHHLRRLRADNPPKNMDYATRTAKQEITEAGKFLTWLDEEQHTKIDDLRQEQIDLYWAEGPSTRKHVRAFLQQRKLTGRRRALTAKPRTAQTNPMASSAERLNAIRVVIESENVIASTRVAAVIFLLYGTPIGRIVTLRADSISLALDGMTISLGSQPAPVPEMLIPLLSDYLDNHARSRAMNKDSPWLFPSITPGRHISANTLWNRLKIFDIQPLATRNTTLFDLTKEIDAATLAAMLGYSRQIMAAHALRSGNTMASYPLAKIEEQRKASPTDS